jgi:hypothetical protein
MPVQQRAQKNNRDTNKATLYAVVFDTYTVKFATLFIFGFLFIQPISFAFAFEEETPVPEEVVIDSEPVPIVEEIVVDEPQQPAQTEVVEVIAETQTESTNETATTQEGADVIIAPTQVASDTQADESSEPVLETESVPEDDGNEILDNETEQATSTASSTEELGFEEAATTTPEIIDDVATSTDEVAVPPEVIATTTATTTEVVNGHNASAFSFDTTQCAVVGDGAYYCSEKEASTTMYTDGVFSAPDSDGDLEIYIRVDGVLAQITHNTIDDSAPYYDALSKRIVWHSSVNDRYQIVSYDSDSGEMTRLTSATYNNMEPVAYGEITLWQAWIDNNWEIMLFDGNTQRQLTNNMREGYIVWQTQFEDGWQVAVYDQETKTVEYIPSEGGLKVENPRFVLVYDSTDENGDVQTVGYDFDTKSSFSLGVLPQELPDELPEPDQTGETRALIQNKQTTREGEQEVIDITTDPVSSGNGTTTDPHTLDLSAGAIASSTPVSTGVIEDVVIPSFTSTASTSQDTFSLDDVVIPPFSTTTTP